MRKILTILTTLVFCVLFWSCRLPCSVFTETVDFQFPMWPPDNLHEYPELYCWRVEIQSERLDEKILYSREKNHIQIVVEKNHPLAITATPVTYYSRQNYCFSFFKPAGCIYPQDYEPEKNDYGVCELTWEKGFTADLMQKIFHSRVETENKIDVIMENVEAFNWKKLQSEIEEKNVNPWLCDESKMLINMSYSNFKAAFLTENDVVLISLPEKVLSSYIPENSGEQYENKAKAQKNLNTLFYYKENLGINVICDNLKKYSAEIIYLPIYNEEL